MSNDEFKDIPGYEGLYQVSNTGKVLGLKRNKLLKKLTRPNGYLYVDLCKNNKSIKHSIHRLVMIAFIGPSDLTVNHKDGDKTNNRLDNLEYVTQLQNSQHAWKSGLKASMEGENHFASKLTEKDVKNIRRLGKNGMSQMDLSRQYGISQSNVWSILKDKTWKHLL